MGRYSRDAGAVLAVAPEPGTAAKLTPARLQSVLGKSGRQRNIESWADRLRTLFTGDYLHRLPLLERAMGRQTALPADTLSNKKLRPAPPCSRSCSPLT